MPTPAVNPLLGIARRKDQAAERHEAEAAQYRRDTAALGAAVAAEAQRKRAEASK